MDFRVASLPSNYTLPILLALVRIPNRKTFFGFHCRSSPSCTTVSKNRRSVEYARHRSPPQRPFDTAAYIRYFCDDSGSAEWQY